MLYRKALKRLQEWKNEAPRKALCVVGARQIGKTTLIRHFAKQNYACFVELNFILDRNAASIFDDALDANTILTNLTAYTKQALIPQDTLILLDEIQACPNARTAIKFLVEDGRFDYIESGSLLGVQQTHVASYPVGFEEMYAMYPMDFEEFLLANGVQPETVGYLNGCFDSRTPVSASVHETLCKLFYAYIVVGGMPDAVQTYVSTHDIGQVLKIQTDILRLYRMDIAQYADENDKPKIRAIFDAIPSQLNDKNRRFYLSNVEKNARQLRYADSFNWLADAGVALPCRNVTAPQTPLSLNEKHSLFKLYQGDVGLLCAASLGNVQYALLKGDLSVNMGGILENVMAQQLLCNGFALRYFDSKKYGEVDFVIQNGAEIDLVEIKSGKDYKLHAALNRVRSVPEWKFRESIVFCRDNLHEEDGVLYLPWYMIAFYRPKTIPAGTIYEVDIAGLKQ